MPKNRHFTFGDMQAQKSREEHLAKMRAMLKPAEEPSQPETEAAPAEKAAAKPAESKAAPAKKAAAKPAAKKPAAKKAAAKKGKK